MNDWDRRRKIGWLAVALSTVVTCLWAFWGIIENFHEGWYHTSLLANLGLMFVQYLSPMVIFMGLTLISILWPRVGAGLHLLFALFAVGFFQAFTNTVAFLLIPVGSPFAGDLLVDGDGDRRRPGLHYRL